MSGHFIGIKVAGDVEKSFIDGINVDVFGCDIAGIDSKNSGAYFNILLHAGRGDDERITWNFLENLKKSIATTDTEGFKSRRYGEANSFVGAGSIGNNKLCFKRIKSTFDTFD